MSVPGDINFDDLKPEEFEQYLPELFATSDKLSDDPRLQKLYAAHPDCLALVRDLETIAETARSLFEPVEEPSDKVWANIQDKLREESALAFDQDGEQLREID
jgi:hypothetical protein